MNVSSFPPPSLTPARLYERYAEAPPEIDVELHVVGGMLPLGLSGVLLRNGPGCTSAHGSAYGHPFDGDGMLHGFTFEAGRVWYRNRWVRTREFEEEERAGRSLYRNFGTNRPGGASRNLLRTRFKNPANTAVVHHAGRTLALWEGGLPHEVDPDSLRTIGRCDFDGVLSRAQSPIDRVLCPETPFASHPKLDPRTGELVGFGLARGLTPKLLVYAVSPAGQMAPPLTIPLRELSFVHDFVITGKHIVFILLPMAFDTTRMLLGRVTAVEALSFGGVDTTIVVVTRADSTVRTFSAGPLFAMHHLNAHDDGDEIVVETLLMDTAPPIAAMARVMSGEHAYPDPRLTRLRIHPGRETVRAERLFERPTEFASVAPREVGTDTSVAFGLGSAEGSDAGAAWHARKGVRSPSFTGISRMDLASRRSTFLDLAHDFPSEPTLVQTADGTDLVLTVVYRTKLHRSELLVLRADTLAPLAVVGLPQHVPPGLHGTFVAS